MIILFGVVGSGKSEQAKRLVAKLGCPYVSTSDLIRQKSNPRWEALMIIGKLLSDEDAVSLIEPELARIDAAHKEFILDGAPRSVGQAEWLMKKVDTEQLKLTAIIHLIVSNETTLARLLRRGRKDDMKEIISERFRQYEEVTTPVLDYLRQHGFQVHEVDGSLSIDEVEKQIWEILKDKLSAPQVR